MTNLTLYGLSVLFWGTSWFAINFQLGTVPPEVSIVYRYALASVLLFAWCRARGIRLSYALRDHLTFVQFGLLLFGLNYVAAYSAQQYITSALNAVAFSSMVWLNILNARIFLKTPLEPRVILGAILGIAGIAVLFWPELSDLRWGHGTLIGASLSLGGAFVASLGNIVSQRAQARHLPVTASNAWGMLYGALTMAIFAVSRGQPFVFDTSWAYVGSLLYLAVFASVLAFGCYLTLLGRIGAHRAGYVVVMFPVVAVVISVLFEGLVLDEYVIAGILLVLAGNTFILSRRRASTSPAAALER